MEAPELLALSGIASLIACLLFARSGLPASATFAAVTASSAAFS
jgi:hypothetical protein